MSNPDIHQAMTALAWLADSVLEIIDTPEEFQSVDQWDAQEAALANALDLINQQDPKHSGAAPANMVRAHQWLQRYKSATEQSA